MTMDKKNSGQNEDRQNDFSQDDFRQNGMSPK